MQKAVRKLAKKKKANCKEVSTLRRKVNQQQLCDEIDRLTIEYEGEVFIQQLAENILVYYWKNEKRADKVVKELEEVIGEEFVTKRVSCKYSEIEKHLYNRISSMIPKLIKTMNKEYCAATLRKDNSETRTIEIHLEGTQRMIDKGEKWFRRKNKEESEIIFEEFKRK